MANLGNKTQQKRCNRIKKIFKIKILEQGKCLSL